MASNSKKQGGRTTAKGTQPPAKKGKGPESVAAPPMTAPVVNREMRRGGFEAPDTADAQAKQTKRLQLVLGGGGAVVLLLTVVGIAFLGLSGTWIGLLGAVAGVGVGFAVSANRTFLADKALPAAIAIAAVGVLVTVLAATNVLDVHFPLLALVGCGVGAFFAYMSKQQMTAPSDPPAAAQVMLKRAGAQHIEMAGTGRCIWATTDGRINLVFGAAVPTGTDPDAIAAEKGYRKSRQNAFLLKRRLDPGGAETTVTCVLDWDVPTTRDGDITICSVSSLAKVLNRREPGAPKRRQAPGSRPQMRYRAR